MLDTYNVVLLNSVRNFKRNVKSSPLLYFLFSTMMLFSTFLIGFLTLFFIRNEIPVDLNNVFFVVVFLFLLKGSYDFHNYFTKSEPVTYALSTQVSHFKILFEIFLVVFWLQLGLWVFLSSLCNVSFYFVGIELAYPVEYLKFTLGVVFASIAGSIFVLHYFNRNKYRLIPLGLIFIAIYQFNDIISLLTLSIASFVYLLWSFNYCSDSYLYVGRTERKNEKAQMWLSTIKKAVFYKELVILWRERILFSILISAVFMGIGAGYIARFGAGDLLPESLQALVSSISPESYAFFGIYALTIHGAVFISLSFFLNEENTVWLLRHVPVKMKDIVYGKMFAVFMPFLCSIPFVAYYSAFTSGESLVFLIWFLIFSFLAGIIICFPLGARYVGKKSDILLLYSISLLIFVVLGVAFSFNYFLRGMGDTKYYLYILAIVVELLFLFFVSVEITANSMTVKYRNIIN